MPEKREHLPTAWRVPDDVWALIQPLLAPEKPPATPGRRATAFRRVLDGIVYVLPTGCQWTALPRELGSGSMCYRRLRALREAVAAPGGPIRRVARHPMAIPVTGQRDGEGGFGGGGSSAGRPPSSKRRAHRPDVAQYLHSGVFPWASLSFPVIRRVWGRGQ